MLKDANMVLSQTKNRFLWYYIGLLAPIIIANVISIFEFLGLKPGILMASIIFGGLGLGIVTCVWAAYIKTRNMLKTIFLLLLAGFIMVIEMLLLGVISIMITRLGGIQ